jgi:hypothetical protein
LKGELKKQKLDDNIGKVFSGGGKKINEATSTDLPIILTVSK